MPDWVIQEQKIGIPQIDEVGTTLSTAVALGEIVKAKSETYNSGEFIYLKGAADVAEGSWVTYNLDDGSVTLLAANAIGPVAVAMAATVADTYGFYQIQGKAVGKCLASFADNANVYCTSTAGSVDDSAVAGDLVFNAKGASAIGTPSSGLAEFEIARPFVKDGLDDAVS